MRIGIDITPFAVGRMGGTETYVRHLLRALIRLWPEHSYVLFDAHGGAAEELGVAQCRNVEVIVDGEQQVVRFLSGPFTQLRTRSRVLLRGMGESFAARLVRWRAEVASMQHLDCFFFPFTNMPPHDLPCASVLTVLDIQHEDNPDCFSGVLSQRALSFQPATVFATRILAISQFVRDRLLDVYGTSAAKIDVALLGTQFGGALNGATARKMQAFEPPYLFYPANAWPHKNHVVLLRALRKAIDSGFPDLRLKLSGSHERYGGYEQLWRTCDELGLRSHVDSVGFVDDAQIQDLYRGALALVYPSLYEGFGLPVIEAMACGCPVICSHAASLPEIAGDAALLFDPADVDDMCRAIMRIVGDGTLRAQLSEKGRARAVRYTWEATAAGTLASLEKAVADFAPESGRSPSCLVSPVRHGRVFDGAQLCFRAPAMIGAEGKLGKTCSRRFHVDLWVNGRHVYHGYFAGGQDVLSFAFRTADPGAHGLQTLVFRVSGEGVGIVDRVRSAVSPRCFTLEEMRITCANGTELDLVNPRGKL